MQIQINHSEFVDEVIKRVKKGEHSAETAKHYLETCDVYVGRGTFRRLLQAEAHAILAADHAHIAG